MLVPCLKSKYQVSKLQKDVRAEPKLLNKRLRDDGDEESFPSKVREWFQ